jgi:hypothetical protein
VTPVCGGAVIATKDSTGISAALGIVSPQLVSACVDAGV